MRPGELLALIIPQQDSKGSYNHWKKTDRRGFIIPQQDSKGSYNIPQQETLGNYNSQADLPSAENNIPQQETLGNYNPIYIPRKYVELYTQHPHKSYNEKSPSSCC